MPVTAFATDLARALLAYLAVEAGRTVLLDREDTLERANRARIAIVGVRDKEVSESVGR